jgi:DNA-binding XRE family transcriptional regulator
LIVNNTLFAIYLLITTIYRYFNTIYYYDNVWQKTKRMQRSQRFSQNEMAKAIEVHHSIIGKYERDEVKPSIDVVKKWQKL